MTPLTHHEQTTQHLVFAAQHLLAAHTALDAGDRQTALNHANDAEIHVRHAETHQTYMMSMETRENTEKTTLTC